MCINAHIDTPHKTDFRNSFGNDHVAREFLRSKIFSLVVWVSIYDLQEQRPLLHILLFELHLEVTLVGKNTEKRLLECKTAVKRREICFVSTLGMMGQRFRMILYVIQKKNLMKNLENFDD